MNRNPLNTESWQNNRKAILRKLLTGEVPFEKLSTQVEFKHATLSKHLTNMEKEGLIKHILLEDDRRKRSYKITSKGLTLLNKLDDETKSKVFSASLLTIMPLPLLFYFAYDSRLSPSGSQEIINIYLDSDKELSEMQLQKVPLKGSPEEQMMQSLRDKTNKKYESVMTAENLHKLSPKDIILKDNFFVSLTQWIGQAMLYLVIKYNEEKNFELLFSLQYLPFVLAQKIASIGLNPEQFKKSIIFRDRFDLCYRGSQELTPETYKVFLDFFDIDKDLDFIFY